MTGSIPLSNALSEAQPDSLSELMGLDPEDARFPQALPKIVEALRAQRARNAQAAALGRPKKVTAKADTPLLGITMQSSDDLGF